MVSFEQKFRDLGFFQFWLHSFQHVSKRAMLVYNQSKGKGINSIRWKCFLDQAWERDTHTSTHTPLAETQSHAKEARKYSPRYARDDRQQCHTLLDNLQPAGYIVFSPQSLVLSQLPPSPLQLLEESNLIN